MSNITFYHNPRCFKSRQALALLQDKGVEPEIILYLKTPPTPEVLGVLLGKLGIRARELMRTKEAVYKTLELDDPSLSDTDLIDAMCREPILIERPIAVAHDRAVIGRPPENVLALL